MIASGKKVGLEMKWNNESKRETEEGIVFLLVVL
jgi:hypothetical protein